MPAVGDGYAALDFRDLSLEASRREALAQQFHAMHLGLDAD